jgi:hypothetical protein
MGYGLERTREKEQVVEDRIESDGPSPSPSDQDPLEELEEEIEQMDRPVGVDERTTATETTEGDTMDERLARETADQGGRRPEASTTIAEDDATDEESELIGEAADVGGTAPEEAAMHVRDRAPGATDHPDDYVDE